MEEEHETGESVYEESDREDKLDNDEISPEEEGFMKGYDDAETDEEVPEADEEE